MLQLASAFAVVLFLLPVVAFVALRARRDSALWEIALDVPLGTALDLFSVLVLAFVFRLEVAFMVSRAIWVAGSVAVLVRRRRGASRWPKELTPRVVLAAGLGAAAGALLSLQVSRTYSIFDRWWHIPLVSSLRGQTLPFHNVFDVHQRLFYHYSGDVFAAMMQSASLAVIHSARALSITHDVQFGLIGLCLGLVMCWWGHERFAAIALGVVAVLTAGPMTLLRGGVRSAQHGYSIINYFSISFRPHDALGGLMIAGLLVVISARATSLGDPPALQKTAIPLVACVATLAITDEPSVGILGLALGLTWLLWPAVVDPRRSRGLLVLAGLAAALLLPNLIFGGTLYPSGEHHHFAIVPFRSPGCYTPMLPLATAKGREMLFFDVLPTGAVLLGMALHWLTRRRDRGRGVMLVFTTLVVTLSLLGLTLIDMDHEPVENHRFMLVAEFATPLLGVLFLAPGRLWEERASRPSPYAVALIVGGMLCGTLSTADWLYGICPHWAQSYKTFWSAVDHYNVDCRKEAAAHFGMKPEPSYMAQPISYIYAGCIPVYEVAKRTSSHWKLTIGAPMIGPGAVRLMSEWPRSGPDLTIVCPRGTKQSDIPCQHAVRSGRCHDLGQYMQVCSVPPSAER